jgi:hypothetical protein
MTVDPGDSFMGQSPTDVVDAWADGANAKATAARRSAADVTSGRRFKSPPE